MAADTTLTVNSFDAIVLTVLGLSAVVAFFRGFIRELLSLLAWVGAALVTIYLFPHANDLLKSHIHGNQSGTVAAGAAALGTYLLALIFFAILNSIILRYVKSGAEVGLLDNFLGLMFGAFRGAFIIALGYLIMAGVIPKDNPPEWLKTSITRPYVENAANILSAAAPNYLHEIEGFLKKEEEKAQEDKNPDNRNPAVHPGYSTLYDQMQQQQQPGAGGNVTVPPDNGASQ